MIICCRNDWLRFHAYSTTSLRCVLFSQLTSDWKPHWSPVCFGKLSDSSDGTLAMTTSTFNDKHNRARDVVRQNELLISMPTDGCYVLIVDSFSYLDQQLVEREFFEIIIQQGTNVGWSYVNNDEGYAIVQLAMLDIRSDDTMQMSESNWRVREQLPILLIRFSRCSNNDNRSSWWRYPVTSHVRWSTHRLESFDEDRRFPNECLSYSFDQTEKELISILQQQQRWPGVGCCPR